MKLTVLALLGTTLAVKDYLFRKCDTNPFCNRNRHYAQQQKQVGFDSPYTLVDLKYDQGVQATLNKQIPEGDVKLEFSLDFLEDIVHIIIDEPVTLRQQVLGKSFGAKERFSPAPFMLETENYPAKSSFDHRVTGNTLILTKEQLEVTIELAPFKLTLARNGEDNIVLNGDSLLNFEHLRVQGASQRNSWESDFGAWEDTFDGHTDKKSRGPESIALDINFEGYKHVYGIPEHADSMNLRDTVNEPEPYRLFNVDIFEYETNSRKPMYGSIPFMVAQKKGSAAGVFWLNAADSYIDIDRTDTETKTHWISENGKLDLYLFARDSANEVLADYSRLTGTSALPQMFATGYHQCRWNYNSEDDVLSVNSQFDEKSMPFDVIWLDVEYTVNKKYFTWNEDAFPDPTRMLSELDKQGRKLVTIIDPHIKKESGYHAYEGLEAQSLAILDAQAKNPFEGHCWPGNSIWVDSFNPGVQKYWDSLFAMGGILEPSSKNIHIWNDMNEPSVFSGPETSGFKDIVHYGGWQHRDVHNLYGQMFINNTFESMLKRYDGEQRPFILTRSFFAGSQKLAAMWTGDNMAKWEYLKQAIPQVLTQGLSGMPFAGADVGGFFGNPDAELLTRWYQSGIFYPFFRGHAHIDSRRREPYLYDGPYFNAMKSALEFRYKLLPTIYTAFYDASQTLSPVIRPVFYEVPDNEETYAIDDAFFLGDSIYVKPVSTAGAESVTMYIPEDEYYYNYWTNARVTGPRNITQHVSLETIPMYARGGKIHTLRTRPRRSAELMVNDPFTIVIPVSKNDTASGKLYLDDGISYDHEKGDYVLINFDYSPGKITGKVQHAGKGDFGDMVIERIIVMGASAASAEWQGKNYDVVPIEGGFYIRNPRVPINSDWTITLK